MTRFILRRLAVGILVALTVIVLSFLLTRLSGDLAISIAGPQATQTDIEIIRKAYGLDQPLYVQFANWAGRAAVGDFGESYYFKDKVSNLIARRMPITHDARPGRPSPGAVDVDPARHPRSGPRRHLGRSRGDAVHDDRPGDAELLACA